MIKFICKYNKEHFALSNGTQKSGLKVSAHHAAKSLMSMGYKCEVHSTETFDELKDACKDADFIFIQAIWVSIYDLNVLKSLFPKTIFIIQIRSNIPFLANETNGYEYIKECRKLGIEVAFNDSRAQSAIGLGSRTLQNMFYPEKIEVNRKIPDEYLDAGCFGAIRPMKNILIQALSAMKYADKHGKTLRFHINSTRIQGGNSTFTNLLALFDSSKHRLIGVPWMPYKAFLKYLNQLDISMQVSFSESFNYVMADSVSMLVPSLGSKEIKFIYGPHPDTGCPDSIVRAIEQTINDKLSLKYNFNELALKHGEAANEWKKFLEEKKNRR